MGNNAFIPVARKAPIVLIAYAILLSALAAGSYWFYLTNQTLKATQKELADTISASKTHIASLRNEVSALQEEKTKLSEELGRATVENGSLSQTLTAEQSKNDLFASQIQAIGGTVGTLKKLSETDKELLQKYSKISFLNEHYVPQKLTLIETQYLYNKERETFFHADAYPYLKQMLEAASGTVPMLIISAYRSFGEQASLKSGYKMMYGSGANAFSADQGYSEHQLGTTVDLTTPKLKSSYTSFASANAFSWMNENAYKYGFILSYPKGNTYYQYEPWHWRYVGRDLALALHNTEQRFYDVPQRDIDQYLISIF